MSWHYPESQTSPNKQITKHTAVPIADLNTNRGTVYFKVKYAFNDSVSWKNLIYFSKLLSRHAILHKNHFIAPYWQFSCAVEAYNFICHKTEFTDIKLSLE